jgi:hypothetical protein
LIHKADRFGNYAASKSILGGTVVALQADQAKGLFASLFDFNFTSFITLKFLKVIYIILMGVIALGAFLLFIGGLVTGTATSVFAALIIVPIGAFLYLLVVRVYLESLALFFRIGENTQAIRQSLGGSPGPMPGGFGGYPTPPPQPQSPPPGAGSWQQAPSQPQQPPTGGGWGVPPQQPPQPPPGQTGFPPPGGQ